MKQNFLVTLVLTTLLLTSCNKKEELYEVEIPESPFIAEEETEASPKSVVAKEGTFKMKGLNFDYNNLEPNLDSKTIELHYAKHHLNHLEKLNELIKGTDLETNSIEEILTSLTPENIQLINNAGGYYNHNLYWEVLGKKQSNEPTGKIAQFINRDFGSFENFKNQIKKVSNNLIGSGWVWLILTDQQNLKIITTANQNNPLMPFEPVQGYPLMNIDLWEHAYYLKYKDNVSEYIDNYLKRVDWNKINYRIDLNNK